MSIAAQEEKLFARWEKVRNPFFVRDGIVCEEAYNDSKLKTAFVMKEYAHKNKGHDLRKIELKNPSGQGWWKVARILHGLRNIDDPQEPWTWKMHPSICAFNLNKKGGNRYTNMVQLALIAMEDRKFIQRQFEIYDPDLTICGGTYQIFRFVCGHGGEEKRIRGVSWYQRSPGKYVVGIQHPAYPKLSHEDVIKAVKKILRG